MTRHNIQYLVFSQTGQYNVLAGQFTAEPGSHESTLHGEPHTNTLWITIDDQRTVNFFLQWSDLLPLRPASLTQKNRQRRKIFHGMRPVGRKERSIDLKIFW